MMPAVRMLARYKRWADGLLYQALARLPAEALSAPRAISFGSVLRTLNHVCAMDFVWQSHLQGRAHGLTTRQPQQCPPFEELRSRQADMDEWYVRYAEECSDTTLAEVVNFEFIGGTVGSMTRHDILLHVVNHTTYHRGHIADMMYQVPAHPPTTDLPVFLRQASATEL